jgi:hypothetical protein
MCQLKPIPPEEVSGRKIRNKNLRYVFGLSLDVAVADDEGIAPVESNPS